jgi:wobble nucleotide-excising tRNase
MPICTNPKCGEISKISSQICPFCGQKSLSQIDKNQVNGDKSTAISMENFIRITDDVPAPRERVIPKDSRKKPRRTFWNRSKD